MFCMRRDTGGYPSICQRLPEGSGTVGPVGQQEAGGRQLFKNGGSRLVIVGLSLGQMQQQRSPLVVADHLQLGGQAASATSNTSG